MVPVFFTVGVDEPVPPQLATPAVTEHVAGVPSLVARGAGPQRQARDRRSLPDGLAPRQLNSSLQLGAQKTVQRLVDRRIREGPEVLVGLFQLPCLRPEHPFEGREHPLRRPDLVLAHLGPDEEPGDGGEASAGLLVAAQREVAPRRGQEATHDRPRLRAHVGREKPRRSSSAAATRPAA
jgi:hypothetical protein